MTDPNLATPVEDCKKDTVYGVGYGAPPIHKVTAPGRVAILAASDIGGLGHRRLSIPNSGHSWRHRFRVCKSRKEFAVN